MRFTALLVFTLMTQHLPTKSDKWGDESVMTAFDLHPTIIFQKATQFLIKAAFKLGSVV